MTVQRCGYFNASDIMTLLHTHTHTHTHSLPLIISTFDGPPRLYEAVEREVCRWKTLGPAYFCPSNTENLETELATLQEQR